MSEETTIRDDVMAVFAGAGFEVRDTGHQFAITGTVDSAALLIEHFMERESRTENIVRAMRQEIGHLRAQIYPANPRDTAAWRLVPMKSVMALSALIDPPPFAKDGTTYVFKNPMAAEILTQISAEVRAMFAAVPPTPPEAE